MQNRMLATFQLLAMLTTLVSSDLRGDESQNTARNLLRRLRDYEASIQSLELQFRRHYIEFPGFETRAAPDCLYHWVMSGRRRVVFSDAEFDYGGRWARVWSAWNESQTADVSYFPSDSKRVKSVVYHDAPTGAWVTLSPVAFALGWQLRGFTANQFEGETLLSLMESANPADISEERARFRIGPHSIEEFPAVKWTLRRFTPRKFDAGENQIEHCFTAYFDRKNGWLPRAWTILPDGAQLGEPLQQGSQPFAVLVQEYMSTNDPLLKTKRLIPKVVIECLPLHPTVSVIEVATVNAAVPRSVFEPHITPGAKITHNPGSRLEVTTYSGENGERLNQELNARDSVSMNSDSLPEASVDHGDGLMLAAATVDAGSPQTTDWLSFSVLVTAVCSLIGAVYFGVFHSGR